MGTRSKTMVIKNKKVVINQYGQWDGYPTTATFNIVNFLRKNSIKRINRLLSKIEYKEEKNNLIFNEMTISLNDVFGDIQKLLWDERYKTSPKRLVNLFGYEKASLYLATTRDTGYKILNIMKKLHTIDKTKKIPIIINNYDGCDIAAKNIINLDNKTLTTIWLGKSKTWDLKKLPTYKELEKFEKEVEDAIQY